MAQVLSGHHRLCAPGIYTSSKLKGKQTPRARLAPPVHGEGGGGRTSFPCLGAFVPPAWYPARSGDSRQSGWTLFVLASQPAGRLDLKTEGEASTRTFAPGEGGA